MGVMIVFSGISWSSMRRSMMRVAGLMVTAGKEDRGLWLWVGRDRRMVTDGRHAGVTSLFIEGL